jgi:hypothetical protein
VRRNNGSLPLIGGDLEEVGGGPLAVEDLLQLHSIFTLK